jgi:hypothetical protein
VALLERSVAVPCSRAEMAILCETCPSQARRRLLFLHRIGSA